MTTQLEHKKSRPILRIILWVIAAIYTLILPDAILIYHVVVKHFSPEIAKKVPLAFVILLGVVYLISSLAMKKGIRSLALLVPCAIIVYAFVTLEPNPNKHIHIPEYIIMSWILFEALALDYRAKGIFILIFICSSLLGIVDELLQGMHPERFYGWQDMVMNSAATVIGIFTLAGLRTAPAGDWAWIGCLKKHIKAMGIMFFGAVGAVLACVYLFDVQAHRTFWGVYPGWLLAWSGLFVITGSAVMLKPGRFCTPLLTADDQKPNPADQAVTARLWTLCPLVILMVMHGLVLLIAAGGFSFR